MNWNSRYHLIKKHSKLAPWESLLLKFFKAELNFALQTQIWFLPVPRQFKIGVFESVKYIKIIKKAANPDGIWEILKVYSAVEVV